MAAHRFAQIRHLFAHHVVDRFARGIDVIANGIHDVINWQVGTRIPLNATPQSDIALLCGDVPMFSGRMGRKGGNIAVRIGEKIDRIRGLT